MAVSTKGTERTFGQLVADATGDISAIVKGEVALAKMEIKADIAKGVKGGALLAGAGLLGLFAFAFFLTAAAWGIHSGGLPIWLGFLIVGGALLLITLILALVGVSALKKIQGKPQKTISNAQQTVSAIKPPKAS